jgi:hypothetical protein
MKKQFGLFAVIAALAIFNGVFSARSFVIFALQGIWYPAFLPSPLILMLSLSGVISAVLHLLVTAIPAAVFEKCVPKMQNQSILLWLGASLLPTFQTLRHIGWL